MDNKNFEAALAKRLGGPDKASRALNILAQKKVFIDAIGTPAGKELLADLCNCLDECISKLIVEESIDTRAEVAVLTRLSERWSRKINSYNNQQQQIMGAMR